MAMKIKSKQGKVLESHWQGVGGVVYEYFRFKEELLSRMPWDILGYLRCLNKAPLGICC